MISPSCAIQTILLAALMLCHPLHAMSQEQPAHLAERLLSDRPAIFSEAYASLMRTPNPAILPFLELRYDAALAPETLMRLWDVAAPICDATCIPYLSSALRHDRREVVLRACLAAEKLGRPELKPALMDLLTRHPDESVRYAAVRALEPMVQAEQYDEMLNTVRLDQPDAAALRIVRMMPPSRMPSLLERSVVLARDEHFSTSIIAAWVNAHQAVLLFDALLSSDVPNLPSSEQAQTLLALVRLAPHVSSMTAERRVKLLALPEQHTEDIIQKSLILAPFEDFFSEIMRMARTMPDVFTPDLTAALIERFPSHAMAAMAQLVMSDAELPNGFSPKRLTQFFQPDAATYAFLSRLADIGTSGDLALRASHAPDDRIVRLAVRALARQPEDTPQRAERLFALLGHHAVAEQAATIPTAYDPLPFILEDPSDDTLGARYYARWSLARHALLTNTCPPEALEEARRVLSEPRRRHALPAIALFIAAKQPLPEIAQATQLSASTQRLLLLGACRSRSLTPSALQQALRAQPDLRAQAYLCLIEDEALRHDFVPDATFSDDIRTHHTQVALRAMHVTQKLAQSRIPLAQDIKTALLERLYDQDERIVHNALLALRAMHALPPKDTLLTLYSRARRQASRDLLALLADLPPTAPRHPPIPLQTHVSGHPQTRLLDQAFDMLDMQDIATRFGFD